MEPHTVQQTSHNVVLLIIFCQRINQIEVILVYDPDKHSILIFHEMIGILPIIEVCLEHLLGDNSDVVEVIRDDLVIGLYKTKSYFFIFELSST